MVWEKLEVAREVEREGNEDTMEVSVKRWDHTLNIILGGLLFYIFGGVDADNLITNEVLIFDIGCRKWRQPLMRGVPPEARMKHTATLIGENIFVFGGGNANMGLYNDLHLLNTSTNTWTAPVVTGDVPPPRRGHVAAAIGKQLFIHGGCGEIQHWNSTVLYDDLYILDTETFVWRRAVTSGVFVPRLENHTCSAWGNKLVIVGGKSERDYLSEVYILDTETLVWTWLRTCGQFMPPRAGHTTVSFGGNLFVFGGHLYGHTMYDDLYKIELATGARTKIAGLGGGPSARSSSAGDVLLSELDGVLVLFGGCDSMLEAKDDVYYFYTGFEMEAETNENETPTIKKEKHDNQGIKEEVLACVVINTTPGDASRSQEEGSKPEL